MVDKNEIIGLLKQYFKTGHTITISDDGLISCDYNVILKQTKKWERLPVSFDRVNRSFSCSRNKLQTLEGAPQSVGHDFDCTFNKLTTLEHAPQSVGLGFWCDLNKLTTLAGAPQSVGGTFSCRNNRLTSLENAPQHVGGNFWCSGNKLASLAGLPVVTGTLRLSYSSKLPLLRCLLANKVEFDPKLENKTVENILNRYAGQGRRAAHLCAKELIASGFEGNAKW